MAGMKNTVSILFMNRLKQLGLLDIWLWVADNNPSGRVNYHNNYHIYFMTWLCDQIFGSQSWDEQAGCDIKSLLVACMFHDYDHTGGKKEDSINVNRAIDAFQKAYRNLKMVDINPELVVSLIRITEYPYTDQARTLEEQCMRDADLLYTTVMGDPEIVMLHLCNEMEILHKRTYTSEEMLKGYETFIMEATLHTDIAKIIRDEESPKFIERMKKAYCL